MINSIKKFHHYGLAIESFDVTSKYLKSLNYELGQSVYDENQKIFCSLNTHTTLPPIELLWAGTEKSPIDNILKNKGSSIYHICYEVEDLDKLLQELKSNNIKFLCISQPKPAILFNYRRVCFYHIHGFGIVEYLLDT